MNPVSRRRFIAGAAQGAVFASVSGTVASLVSSTAAAREAPARILATALTPSIRFVSGAGGNVVALHSPDGTLLVDGGLAQHSSALLKAATAGAKAARISVLFNTHWHPEQTGSNERIGKSGATIIAHENTRLWLSRPIKASWLDKPFGPLPAKARPNKTTYTTDQLSFGGEDIEYGYLAQAHTDGDIYVHFRNANVLATGGVVSAEGWPRLDWETGGWIGGLVAGYDHLLKVADASTHIVPANGPVLARADLESHRKMYFTLYERLVALLNKGLGPDEVVAAGPAKEFAEQWGDPKAFVDSAFRSLWGHFAPDA
jgi:cyclase